MKLKLNELLNLKKDRVFELDNVDIDVKDNLFLRGLKKLDGYIAFYLDVSDSLIIEYDFKGYMVCPDSRTLEDVLLPFSYDESQVVVIDEFNDGFYIYDNEELEDLIISIVSPDAPIKVDNSEKLEYHRGDGWAVMSEDDFSKSQKEVIDPRLEKLREFKEE